MSTEDSINFDGNPSKIGSIIAMPHIGDKGIKKISTISAVIILLVTITSWTLNDPVLTVASIVSFHFYIYGIVRKTENDLIRMVRYSIFLFSFFPLTFYPLLSIAFIFNFYFCKYYFWHRYKIHFPAFAID